MSSNIKTSDITERIERMQGASKAKRADQWIRLKSQHPEIADHIKLVASVFGKPKKVMIKENGDKKWKKLG